MPIANCPLISFQPDQLPRPFLPIKIINPHSGNGFKTWGLVDTGADECAIPAIHIKVLGHDLKAGKEKAIATGNGITLAYSHTTKVEIYHCSDFRLLYTIDNVLVDFMQNLNVTLLGAKNFLSKFILTIDYPKKTFSIKLPLK